MYHYQPSSKVHIVESDNAGSDGRTLCGMTHEGDVTEVGTNPDTVLPWNSEYCYRCRAAYVKQVRAALEVDTTDLDEGDVVEFWTHDDPTDPSSSLCLRKTGRIVETPPYTDSIGRNEYTVEHSYKVQLGASTYTQASPDRIWRVNEEGLELSGGVFG